MKSVKKYEFISSCYYWGVGDDFSGGPSHQSRVFKTKGAAIRDSQGSVFSVDIRRVPRGYCAAHKIIDPKRGWITGWPKDFDTVSTVVATVEGTNYVPDWLEW